MPKLKQVIEEFTKGFQYLDSTDHRQTRWYEFFLKHDGIRKKLTNVVLTTAIEAVAKQSCTNLVTLTQARGDDDFSDAQQHFFQHIADTLHQVQVKRFVHGEIVSVNYQHTEQSILERSWTPKKASLFEDRLINGLKTVKVKFPELADTMNAMITKIANSEQTPTPLLRESLTIVCGQPIFSAVNPSVGFDCTTAENREKYAEDHITTLQFS